MLQRLRQRGDGLAVLVVTARDGLAAGARARPRCRRLPGQAVRTGRIRSPRACTAAAGHQQWQSDLRIGRLRLDLAGHRVWIDDQPLELTAREFGLLSALAVRAERIVSRAQLVEALCDWGQDLTDNGLDIALHLRRKLQPGGIRTVRGLATCWKTRRTTAPRDQWTAQPAPAPAAFWLPMLALLTFNTILAYYVALDYSNRIHDRNLIDDTHSFAQMLSGMPVTSELSPQARFLTEYEPDGHRYFNVDSRPPGTLSGNADFSAYAFECTGVDPTLYDGILNGQPVRMATVCTRAMNDPQDQLAVTVAESMAERRQRARDPDDHHPVDDHAGAGHRRAGLVRVTHGLRILTLLDPPGTAPRRTGADLRRRRAGGDPAADQHHRRSVCPPGGNDHPAEPFHRRRCAPAALAGRHGPARGPGIGAWRPGHGARGTAAHPPAQPAHRAGQPSCWR